VADVTDILLGRLLYLPIDKEGGTDDRIERQEEETPKSFSRSKGVLAACSCVNIDMQVRGKTIACFEQITQREAVEGRQCWNEERTP
jgi:hypothetical protein